MSDAPKPSLSVAAAPSTQMPENFPQESGISGHSRAFSGADLPDFDPGDSLSNAQVRAIQLALDGHRWGRIAQLLHIDPKTLWRWRNENPDFQSTLTDARTQRIESADQRAQWIAERATETLDEILHNSADNHRLRAAQIALQHSVRIRPKPTTHNPDDEYWPEPELPPKVG